jgi:hypothetical protein
MGNMTRVVCVASAVLVGLTLSPRVASAQARVIIAPSAGAGFVLDDNLFSARQGVTTSDMIMRITPGLSASRETARTYWFGGYSFDAERYQDHASLTTPMARQSASMLGRIERSSATAVTLQAGYESSIMPNELNINTGLNTGRMRAWRWHGGPELRHATSPRSFVGMRYDVTTEGMADRRIVTNAIDFTVAHEIGARSELRVEPFVRHFLFDDTSLATAGAIAGYTRRLTPFTSLILRGGPRYTQGDSTLRPELDLSLRRRTEYTEFSLNYARTGTTAIGLTGIVDTQRVVASASRHHPAVFDIAVNGGVYFNENAGTMARVYRVSGELTRRISPGLAISAAYAVDLQRGLLVTTHVAGNPAITIGERGSLIPAPLFLIDRTTADVPLRRNVFVIRLVVAPLIHPSRTPPKDKPRTGTDNTSTSGSIR